MTTAHVVDHGGQGTSVVLLHGLGGSHAGWTDVGPVVARAARVRAVDLPGFGLAEPTDSASVGASARAVVDVLEAEDVEPAVLVGNSMGAVVSLLVADRRPDLVRALVLVDPGLPRNKRVPLDREVAETFRPALGTDGATAVRRRWDRLGPAGAVDHTLRLCCADPDAVPATVRDAMVRVREVTFSRPGSARAYAQATRSLAWVLGRRRAFYRLLRRVEPPVLVVHGTEDRLVPVDSAREAVRRRPDWRLFELEGIGHLPQVECAPAMAELLVGWADAVASRRSAVHAPRTRSR